jgi:hypothetical protein
MYPRCGTELGKEWNPDEQVEVLVTDLAGSNILHSSLLFF